MSQDKKIFKLITDIAYMIYQFKCFHEDFLRRPHVLAPQWTGQLEAEGHPKNLDTDRKQSMKMTLN